MLTIVLPFVNTSVAVTFLFPIKKIFLIQKIFDLHFPRFHVFSPGSQYRGKLEASLSFIKNSMPGAG